MTKLVISFLPDPSLASLLSTPSPSPCEQMLAEVLLHHQVRRAEMPDHNDVRTETDPMMVKEEENVDQEERAQEQEPR